MTKRYFLPGVLGGIAMYLWSAIAHVALRLGMIGIQEIPNEQPVRAAMQSSMAGEAWEAGGAIDGPAR